MEHNFPIPVLNNKQRCPYLSLHLECHVGGNANVECFKPDFHGNCHFKKRAERRYEEKK